MKLLLQIVVGILIAWVALWLGFKDADISSILSEIKNIDLTFIYLTTILLVGSHWLRALRWKYILIDSRQSKSKTWPFFSSTMIGYLVNMVIPRGGEIAKTVYLNRTLKTSLSKVIGTVVLERLLDFIMLIIVFGIMSIFYSSELNEFFPGLGIAALFIFIISVVIVFLFTFFSGEKIIARITFWMSDEWHLTQKVKTIFVSISEGIGNLKHSPHKIGILLTSIAIFGLYILSSWVPLYAFQFQESAKLGLTAGAAIMAISSVGVVLPSPGGTGTYHFFCSSALIYLFSVSQIDALSFATVTHLMNALISLGGGMMVYLIDIFFNRNLNPAKK